MLGDNNIRKELIEDAIAPVDNALKMGEGSIKVFTDDIIKKISRETKRSEKVVRQRIIENPNFELYDETIYNGYLDIIKKKADFEVIEKLLKTLNSEDIYSFLSSQNLKFETLDNSVINKERKKSPPLPSYISLHSKFLSFFPPPCIFFNDCHSDLQTIFMLSWFFHFTLCCNNRPHFLTLYLRSAPQCTSHRES